MGVFFRVYVQYFSVRFSAFPVEKAFQVFHRFILGAFLNHFQCTYYHWNCLYFKLLHYSHFYFEVFIFGTLGKIFSQILLTANLVTSNMVYAPSLKCCIIISGRFASIFLSVWTAKSHNTIINFPFTTGSGVYSYHYS